MSCLSKRSESFKSHNETTSNYQMTQTLQQPVRSEPWSFQAITTLHESRPKLQTCYPWHHHQIFHAIRVALCTGPGLHFFLKAFAYYRIPLEVLGLPYQVCVRECVYFFHCFPTHQYSSSILLGSVGWCAEPLILSPSRTNVHCRGQVALLRRLSCSPGPGFSRTAN